MAVTEAASIRVVAVGVCGSDIARRRAGYAVASLGHEIVGRSADGGRVAVRPLNPCGTCPMCRRGWTEQCPADHSIGRHDDGEGGFSGTVRVREEQLYRLPAHLPTPVAALADPLACILHAFHDLPVRDANVLVIGDGSMAALAATHARQLGACHVTLSVKTSDRIERLVDFGDSVVTARELPANHYDVVVESAGGVSSVPIYVAATAVAPLGRVVALGVYAQQTKADIPLRMLLEKESTLRGSKAYRTGSGRDDFASALELLASGPGDYEPIISSTPRWTPDDPVSVPITGRHSLKTVYVADQHA